MNRIKIDSSDKRHFIKNIIIFISILVVVGLSLSSHIYIKRKNTIVSKQIGDLYLQRIESVIEKYDHIAETMKLSTIALDGKITVEKFNEIAKMLYENRKVQAIQYLEKGTVKYTYPLAGNEESLGDDILKREDRIKKAIESIKEDKTIFTGPYEILQGNTAFILRQSIFIDDKFNGFITIIIDEKEFIDICNFEEIDKMGYNYALYKENSQTKYRNIVQGNQKNILKNHSYNASMEFGGEKWSIYIQKKNHILMYIIPIIVAMLGGIFLFAVYKKIYDMFSHYENLKHDASRDSLTGLYNRKSLENVINKNIEQYKSIYGTLIIIDIDNFKNVNDNEGHLVGDEVLKVVSNLIRNNFRDTDCVARLGGDEFSVFLPKMIKRDVLERKIRYLIKKSNEELNYYCEKYDVSLSIGAAISDYKYSDYESIYFSADEAMYNVKISGKNDYSII